MAKESNRRSTGVVADQDLMRKNAEHPTPVSGYDTVEVVQYADESNEKYQERVDDLNSRRENAEATMRTSEEIEADEKKARKSDK